MTVFSPWGNKASEQQRKLPVLLKQQWHMKYGWLAKEVVLVTRSPNGTTNKVTWL